MEYSDRERRYMYLNHHGDLYEHLARIEWLLQVYQKFSASVIRNYDAVLAALIIDRDFIFAELAKPLSEMVALNEEEGSDEAMQ